MTVQRKLLILSGATALLCVAATAVTPDAEEEPASKSTHPYWAISKRNVFGLRDPTPAPETNQPPKQPPVNLTLTGLTTMLGQKRVFLKSPATPAKGTTPAKQEQTYMLSEGQREGDIEVVQINEILRMVKINNAGVEMTLDFTNHGVKMPATAAVAPGTVPPPAGAGGAMQPIPGPPGSGTTGGMRPLPTRPLRAIPAPATGSTSGTTVAPRVASSGGGAVSVTPVQGGGNQAVINVAPVQGGTRVVRPAPAVQPSWPPEVHLTPEEQMLLIEAQREAGRHDPDMPPLPPTPLSPVPQQPAPDQPILPQ